MRISEILFLNDQQHLLQGPFWLEISFSWGVCLAQCSPSVHMNSYMSPGNVTHSSIPEKLPLLTNLSNRKLQAYGYQSTSDCRKLWEKETGKLEVKNIHKLASLEVCIAWRLTVQILESSSLHLTPVSCYSLLDYRQITYLIPISSSAKW